MESCASACATAGIALLGGDTKYLTGTQVGLVLSAFGIGQVADWPRTLSLRGAEPGDCIICTGTIANHAIAVLSEREGLGFERVVRSDCQPLWPVVEALNAVVPDGVVALRDLTRGGLGGALVDLAHMCGHGVTVRRDAVPIARLVEGACEMLGLDPIFLVNEGCLMVVARADRAECILEVLRALDATSAAAVVGEVRTRRSTSDLATIIAQGVESVLVEPTSLSLPRLC